MDWPIEVWALLTDRVDWCLSGSYFEVHIVIQSNLAVAKGNYDRSKFYKVAAPHKKTLVDEVALTLSVTCSYNYHDI